MDIRHIMDGYWNEHQIYKYLVDTCNNRCTGTAFVEIQDLGGMWVERWGNKKVSCDLISTRSTLGFIRRGILNGE
jgi:hypothetical protein